MRFKQFLTESEVKNLAELIHEVSPGYLGRTGRRFLYRGMESSKGRAIPVEVPHFDEGNAYEIKTRTDREPKDTISHLHRYFDLWFEARFGHKFRSAAVFCSGSPPTFYGTKYAIFPIGKWSYVWSPNIRDLSEDFGYRYDQLMIDSNRTPKGVLSFNAIPKIDVFDTMDTLGYTNNGLDKALAGSNEIMVDCESYLAVPAHMLPLGVRWLEK